MIDWARITELRDEIGADDFCDVVVLFLEEVEEEICQLRDGCETAQLEARLHMLKGSALNLGFRTFSEFCQRAETAAANGQHAQIDMPATLASFDASKTAFLSGLERLKSGAEA
ncbi:histidine kinase [Pelagivirga sediminicola]|uniref:Histidine kinase n=1 Tax=Pelagivirga sediminicola TaxID=2170575 RepID=A0A2T7G8L3_9RHOB|nr:Hpt domain-containing protein [Pelagivirga sediminicola]PVA10754.1 histidine kinase [Pelagivirga sediminicola]